MGFRAVFAVITAFWLVMTFLLIRQEFGGKSRVDSAVSLPVVWEKVLTAPDSSALSIYQRRKKIGLCRWTAAVVQHAPTANQEEDKFAPEGRVQRIAGYEIDFEGHVFFGEETNRLRFDLRMSFSTNNSLKTIDLTAGVRPELWELRGNVVEDKVTFRQRGGEQEWEQNFRISDFRNPQKLLINNPVAWAMMKSMGLDELGLGTNIIGSMKWEARTDTFKMGAASARVYRLDTKLMEGLQGVVYISRAGEILRVELPDGYLLLNEAIAELEVSQ